MRCQLFGLSEIVETWPDNWCAKTVAAVDTRLLWRSIRVKSRWLCNSILFAQIPKATHFHLTLVLKDTSPAQSTAQRPWSSMGPLSTLCCSSTAVKYWFSPPFYRTPVDLVILCYLQPQYIRVVITSVLCFTLHPCTLSDLAESYRETEWETVSKWRVAPHSCLSYQSSFQQN